MNDRTSGSRHRDARGGTSPQRAATMEELRGRARDHAADAMDAIVAVMRDRRSASTRLRAAAIILDFASDGKKSGGNAGVDPEFDRVLRAAEEILAGDQKNATSPGAGTTAPQPARITY